MAKNLVIVESPGKIKTISGFLGKDYKVIASFGHIRSLAKTGKYNLGIDLDNNYEPKYVNDSDKRDVIKTIKSEAKLADTIYLASDLDLEGEAIAWHIYDILTKADKAKVKRITFNEITEKAVKEAIDNPRSIDVDRVHAQETRRLLDRIVGFRLSHLVAAKTGSKSAGRVQSAALKILTEKEKEIQAFIPEEYFELYLPVDVGSAYLDAKFNGTLTKKFNRIDNRPDAETVVKELKDKTFKVHDVIEKDGVSKPKPAFTTSTFQQAVSSRLGYSPKKSMQIAQSLYEGITYDGGHKGLITYMRTDSNKLSDEFVKTATAFIISNYGKDYLGPKRTSKKVEGAQEAHEAIRPTDLNIKPSDVRPFLNIEEYKVYEIIYNRALASLMSDAKLLHTTIQFSEGKYIFELKGKQIVFPGYLELYSDLENEEDEGGVLPSFTKGSVAKTGDVKLVDKLTQPPRRYSEAGLVKVLEELGIGRPSTYASIMDILKKRDYVDIVSKAMIATKEGIEVIDMLMEHFSYIIDSTYTSELENRLDSIATGEVIHTDELDTFYKKFQETLLVAQKETESIKPQAIETEEKCPQCGKDLLIRTSRKGDQFYACSGFPRCRFTASLDQLHRDPNAPKHICKVCNTGEMIKRTASKGRSKGSVFYGCNNYPKCKTAVSEEEFNEIYIKPNHFTDISTDSDLDF